MWSHLNNWKQLEQLCYLLTVLSGISNTLHFVCTYVEKLLCCQGNCAGLWVQLPTKTKSLVDGVLEFSAQVQPEQMNRCWLRSYQHFCLWKQGKALLLTNRKALCDLCRQRECSIWAVVNKGFDWETTENLIESNPFFFLTVLLGFQNFALHEECPALGLNY